MYGRRPEILISEQIRPNGPKRTLVRGNPGLRAAHIKIFMAMAVPGWGYDRQIHETIFIDWFRSFRSLILYALALPWAAGPLSKRRKYAKLKKICYGQEKICLLNL
jgi:hypothetical protein